MTFKSLFTAVCVTAGLMLGTAASAQSSLEKILADGVLRVGTTGDFNPMTVRDIASGGYVGFEIDAAQALAADLGVDLELVATDWKTMVAGVLSDKYDMVMSGTSISAGRAKVVGYTNPYIYISTVPMALKSNLDTFQTWDDANQEGVTIAVILGTVFEQQARTSFPNATIVTVEAPANGYQEVLAGRADVTITSTVDAASIQQNFDAIGRFGDEEIRGPRPLAYITHQSNQTLINFVNSWMHLKEAEGFFEGLEEKWGL